MRLTRRLLAAVLIASVLAAGAHGCSPQESGTQAPPDPFAIRVSGSGTCLPLVRILTGAYETQASHSDLSFVYLPGLHSGGGIKGVASGDLEIGAVSRPLNEDERQLDLRYVPLSDDGLVMAVHPSVTMSAITSEQVREIYAGTYTNWSQLGGPDLPLVLLDRNEDESAKIILRQYVLGDTEVAPRAVNLFYESDMVEALRSTPGAIGYFSLGYALSSSPRLNVRFLRLDGVEASVANIKNGKYAVVRPLGVVVSPDAGPEVETFVKWAQGHEAERLMEERGYAPHAGASGS